VVAVLRVVFSSDLHASFKHYRALLDTALDERADLVVLGGDLLPDDLSGTGLADTQRGWVEEALRPLVESYRERGGGRVLANPGNHDTRVGFEELIATGHVEPLHGRTVDVDGWTFVGYGTTPPTPFIVKDFERLDDAGPPREPQPRRSWVSGEGTMEMVEPLGYFARHRTIREELGALSWGGGRVVFVSHCPPLDTPLDLMYGPTHIGSRSVLDFILARQPALSLHGHIHESPEMSGSDRTTLGTTLSLNAGQSSRTLHMVSIELDPGAGGPRVMSRRVKL
jgi:Icc-related predicted phosphoesterase